MEDVCLITVATIVYALITLWMNHVKQVNILRLNKNLLKFKIGGFAFAKSCPLNLIWDDEQKTCIQSEAMNNFYLDSDKTDRESDAQMQLFPEGSMELFDHKNGTDPKTTFKTKINIKINFLNMNIFKPTKKGIRVRICSSSKCIF